MLWIAPRGVWQLEHGRELPTRAMQAEAPAALLTHSVCSHEAVPRALFSLSHLGSPGARLGSLWRSEGCGRVPWLLLLPQDDCSEYRSQFEAGGRLSCTRENDPVRDSSGKQHTNKCLMCAEKLWVQFLATAKRETSHCETAASACVAAPGGVPSPSGPPGAAPAVGLWLLPLFPPPP